MNRLDTKYKKFGLCTDMMNTAELIRNFNSKDVIPFVNRIENNKKIFITGEGSSRIFPAKNLIYNSMRFASDMDIKTEGASQAKEYDLTNFIVFGASNSGKTSELIGLFTQLQNSNHTQLFAVTANTATPLENIAKQTNILKCGIEKSVAATISVIEQALFFDALFCKLQEVKTPPLDELSLKFLNALSIVIPEDSILQMLNADTIYFAGRNNGVAEELTLKTQEIIRKKAVYLEGTYALHGAEEVMTPNDVMIIIDPIEEEEHKFKTHLEEGVGVRIIAISNRQTLFTTILIHEIEYYDTYLQMAAGWNLLVECGLHLDIDLDKPERARKIGNEYLIEV
jgi:glucosamine--fructose-6-phosphate aminotransferase (isomerizing)